MSTLPPPPWFRALGFALGGLALAIWLSAFFNDAKRPTSPQERADRLAATNYAALSLFAPLPPSAPHWEQLLVLQAPTGKGRYPIAQEAAALTIAVAGGSPRLASILACAGAAVSLGWLLGRRPGSQACTDACITGLALLAVCHGLAWQLRDPQPFLILAFSALGLGAWFELQGPSPKKTAGLLLGAGLSGLLLSTPVVFVCFVTAIAADLGFRCLRPVPGRKLPVAVLLLAALPVLGTLLALGIRNQEVVGTPWTSPASCYRAQKTSAPVWFWDGIRPPPDNLDPVMERYDEFVLTPRAQWPAPVYKLWLERLFDGLFLAGGVVWAGLALLVLLNQDPKRTLVPLLMLGGMAAVTLLYYPPNPPWWTFVTAPVLWLVATGCGQMATRPLARRNMAVLCILQVLTLSWGPKLKPLESEYKFQTQMSEVAEKIRETPGKHLVFADFDDNADGRLESADLPRDWDAATILYARDLATAQNRDLAARLPGRTTWRIMIFRDRIGLQHWPAPATPVPTPAAPTVSPDAPASTGAQS